ncbi:MAG: hypothetical protein P1U88_15635 [Thalassobaculaceae bacterium]|nr:hypothetical protein [Thalassobaculaceae bacterium]
MSDSRAVERRPLPFKLSAPENDRLATHVVYALYGASLIFQIPSMFGVILAYLKRGDVEGTYLETHIRWQIRTFWIWLLLTVIGWAGVILLFGWLVLAFAQLWLIYRIVKGWLKLSNDEPILRPGDMF